MEDENNKSSDDLSNLKLYFGIILVVSVLIASFLGYSFGKSSKSNQVSIEKKVLSSISESISNTPIPSLIPTKSVISEVESNRSAVRSGKECNKYGFAQKWEYLTSYILKENDSLTSIAKEQLNDETRVEEILKINGVGPLVIGSTLYLPPSSIKKSSGNLKQIYGKLLEKNSSSWHFLLSSDPEGQGILIPSFLFEKTPNKDSFNIGDCLKVFLDDGYQVYSVSLLSDKE